MTVSSIGPDGGRHTVSYLSVEHEARNAREAETPAPEEATPVHVPGASPPIPAPTPTPTPAREATHGEIDAALQAWNGDAGSKRAVASYMQDHARGKDTAAWLRAEYGGDLPALMTWNRSGENRCQQAVEISRMLKIMSKELNVPVLCLSQLSRVVEEREDKRPVLSDLRGSGPFVPEADIVLFLYQGCYYHEKMKKSDMMECIVAKNVYGESGTVELRWRPKGNRFLVSDNMCCW